MSTQTLANNQLLALSDGALYVLSHEDNCKNWRGLPGKIIYRDGNHVEIVVKDQNHQPDCVISTSPLNVCFKIGGACIRVFEVGAV